ncbi:hypothetical protein KCMC57_up33750 [Kitasatospora sp. CMC57]|uniref:DNA methylase n=1 Tax=Kitasatospora sp. CMC57 TaxID=3231513 RepID=A0AB33JYA6_9ACTN
MTTSTTSTRPLRLLDAFCCAGGAGTGYARAGFDVTGIDINPQPNYPRTDRMRFVKGDAVEYIRAHGAEFDLIHASPPCQFDCTLTAGTNQHRRHLHADLLDDTRAALESTGRPYVIEQPPGRATKRMRADLVLCGEMFGLRVIRHRLFELDGLTAPAPEHVPHRGLTIGYRHGTYVSPEQGRYFQVYGAGGGKGTVRQWQDAMGIHWTTDRRELAEAIPPAYTELIGRQALAQLQPAPTLAA